LGRAGVAVLALRGAAALATALTGAAQRAGAAPGEATEAAVARLAGARIAVVASRAVTAGQKLLAAAERAVLVRLAQRVVRHVVAGALEAGVLGAIRAVPTVRVRAALPAGA